MVVCDPLHRQYLLLPPIPDDLAASVADQLLIDGQIFAETFLVPPGYDEEEAATATEEMSFRVIWMVLLQAKPMAVVFSSRTGQWRALTQSESLPGFVLSTSMVRFMSRHYAHGCFYWISGSSEKLLVLDIQRMEFSMADHPPCARASSDDVAIVEAGQGTIRMFVPTPHTARRSFTVWRNNGGSSTQWQMENETILLPSGSMLVGAVGRHLLLYHVGSSSIRRGCYTRGVDTFQFERVCDSGSLPKPSHVYCNFPPSLLSSPTVSSATPHADVRGEGGAVLVPELQESDPGGVEGPVLSAAAQAPNPLFVVNNEAEVSCGGRGEGGAGAGAGHAEGPGVGDVAGEGMEGDEGPAGTGVSRRTTAAKGNKSFRWRGCFHCWM